MARQGVGLLLLVALTRCILAKADAWSIEPLSIRVRTLLSTSDHKYRDREKPPLYANKVGPFFNPIETYRYYDLPFCRPVVLNEKVEDLGEVLNSDRMVTAVYDLSFKVDRKKETLCVQKLSVKDVRKFRDAVKNDYYFQMYYDDDLPIWGFIGKIDFPNFPNRKDARYYLFTHVHFDIQYSKDRVIGINVATDPLQTVDITVDAEVEVEFLYSAKWREVHMPFEKRMDKYSRYAFLPQHREMHLFSIVIGCITMLVLAGCLATRVLKNAFIKYTRDEETLEQDQKESGWTYVQSFPENKTLFAAIIGNGSQLLALTLCIFGLSLMGVFYPYNRGALLTALVVLYALTSGVAGYVSASCYKQLGGTAWIRNIILTGCLFCGPLFLTFCFLNSVAWCYNSTVALPAGTIVIILLIWMLVSVPLLIVGGIVGKNIKAELNALVGTTTYLREITPLPWYRSTLPQMAMAGFLPFCTIYIELYYIFASVWGHKLYTVYSVLFIVFIILIIVTAFITIAVTYFQLAVEDNDWWWRSILCGGSTGLYIFGYCFYYYARSEMDRFMQTSFFFGYMACVCYGFFLMLGTVGFWASLSFVRHKSR